MKRIGMGIVGVGFVGPHHVDAVRRLGYVDVIAVADMNEKLARDKADALHVPKAYGSYEALLADPAVEVVHNATPNFLHAPVNLAAIARGKHVVCDKPLAMTAAEAKTLVDAANKAGVVHAVTFGYRGNPLVQHARQIIERGEIGRPQFLHGYYLQDWLLKDTDYSWRLEPDKSGNSSALGDIGSHWCDLAQHVSGLRITHVLGDITTVIPKRKRPKGAREAFQAAGAGDAYDLVDIKVEDLASVLLKFDNGAKGTFSVGQVCAGHKNDLVLEVCGSASAVRWRQEDQNELWIGHRDKANEVLQKDPGLVDRGVSGYVHLPGGHQEGWPDANFNLMRDIYGFIAAGRKPSEAHPPAFATFEDGYRANVVVEAIIESARHGGVWTKVNY
jgi:predicted dehydrogenase